MNELGFAFIKGFLTGAGLIVAIGAQNAYVLTQGVKRHYPSSIALTCFVVDALLIVLGVAGLGSLIQQHALLLWLTTLGGAMFLTVYALRSFRAAFKGESLKLASQSHGTRWQAIAAVLALSLLNPHVYLDTVVLLGAVAGTLPISQQPSFAAGAVLASFIWFFSLAYGARLLAPVLSTTRAWRILDSVIGLIMLSISLGLWLKLVHLVAA